MKESTIAAEVQCEELREKYDTVVNKIIFEELIREVDHIKESSMEVLSSF